MSDSICALFGANCRHLGGFFLFLGLALAGEAETPAAAAASGMMTMVMTSANASSSSSWGASNSVSDAISESIFFLWYPYLFRVWRENFVPILLLVAHGFCLFLRYSYLTRIGNPGKKVLIPPPERIFKISSANKL